MFDVMGLIRSDPGCTQGITPFMVHYMKQFGSILLLENVLLIAMKWTKNIIFGNIEPVGVVTSIQHWFAHNMNKEQTAPFA